jgi:hypothetical protein
MDKKNTCSSFAGIILKPTNQIMMKYLFSFFFLFAGTFLFAAGVTYIGPATGTWEDPNNWDSGKVPQKDETAIIPGGKQVVLESGFYSIIGQLEVQTNATLTIEGDLEIQMEQAIGLLLNGTLFLEGTLLIYQDKADDTAVRTNGGSSLAVLASGELLIYGVERAITMMGGTFDNQGFIDLDEIFGNQAVYVQSGAFNNSSTGEIYWSDIDGEALFVGSVGDFENEGDLVIGSDASGTGIVNQGSFFNVGEIRVNESGLVAIRNYGSNFVNKGEIYIRSGGLFDVLSGALINQGGGLIRIFHTNNKAQGIKVVGPGSSVINIGDIEISDITTSGFGIALLSSSFFFNQGGDIIIAGSKTYATGISLSYGCHFHNNDGDITLELTNTTGKAFNIGTATFNNKECGQVEILDGSLRVFSPSGEFNNEAWLDILGADVTYYLQGDLVNEGLIYDPHGTLAGYSVDNQSLILDPLSPPVTVGYNYNALNLGDLDDINLLSWNNFPGGSIVGTYLPSSNILKLYNNALGLSSVMVHLELDHDGCNQSRWFEVPAPGNVQPLPPPPAPQQEDLTQKANWNISPNPASDHLDITMGLENDQLVRVQLLNELGQTVFESQEFAEKGTVQTFTRPSNLATGWYMIRILGEDGLLFSGKVIWQ